MESSSPGLLKNGKMNLCMSMGSRENKQNKVRTQLWDTLYFDFPHLLRSWDRIDSWERPSSRLPRWDRWSRPRSCSLQQLTYSQFYILLNQPRLSPASDSVSQSSNMHDAHIRNAWYPAQVYCYFIYVNLFTLLFSISHKLSKQFSEETFPAYV